MEYVNGRFIDGKYVISELLAMIKSGKYDDYELFSYIKTTKHITAKAFCDMLETYQGYYSKSDLEILYSFAYDLTKEHMYKIRLDKILSYNSDVDAINYMISNNYTTTNFIRDLDYIRPIANKVYSASDYQRLNHLLELYRAFNKQRKILEKEKTKEEFNKSMLEDARKRVKNVIDNDLSSADSKDIEVISKLDLSLYEEYKKYISQNQAQRYAVIVSKGKRIISLILNGIDVDNDKKRPFDIVDYFTFTKILPAQMFNIIKSYLSPKERIIFKKFETRYEKMQNLDLRRLYSAKQVFGAKLDENGNIIEGTGRIITDYEKQNIVIYMKNNNLPLYSSVYQALFLRWQKGYLEMPTKFNENIENKNKSLV